ncbi:MAG TPA: ABC transporter ATP-binding protein [Flavobacteriaceae bacterium]|nr:ABC transporter ATP-binding protein [Flavobacteriaceae bacterium]
MVFEIDNVVLNFGEKNILKAVYLKAETGKISGILGRNGTGKSCLLKIIFGQLKPKSKLFRIDKKPILENPYCSGKVKFLPQHHFIPKDFSIEKAFRLFHLNWADFCSIFESFSKYREEKIGNLSGGERRLIETYLILTGSADLILLDEPFSHIAPVYVQRLIGILQREKQRKAIVVTDHLYREILAVSDDVYLLKEGETRLIRSEEDLRFQGYLA